MDIKVKLKNVRLNKGLTQKDVADKIGVRVATISDIENGKYIPTLENTILLADLFGLSLDEFIEYKKIHAEYSKELANLGNKKKDEN